MTWEQLWEKYEKRIRAEDPSLEGEDLKKEVCLRILEKSCSTNKMFNDLAGCSELNNFSSDSNGDSKNRSGGGGAGVPLSSLMARSDRGSSCDDDDDCDLPVEFSDEDGACAGAGAGAVASRNDGELARAYIAEQAAACAGALRLTRLIQPFRALKDGKNSKDENKPAKRRSRKRFGRRRVTGRASHPSSTT